MFEVNKEAEKYRGIKPKYFTRKEIDELNIFLQTLEEYIKELELKQKNCHCYFLTNENKMLKMKLSTIKYNLENVEIDNRIHNNKYNKEKGMKDLIILLEDIKNYSNVAIKIIICILLIIFKYLYYVYNLYNMKKQ